MIRTWAELKAVALELGLPGVEERTAWGNPVLKAHGKMWTWWSPYMDAALFKCDRDERDMPRQADPDTFPAHPHYENHNLILVAAGRIDRGWAEARLVRTWRDMAPKRVLAQFDAAPGSG